MAPGLTCVCSIDVVAVLVAGKLRIIAEPGRYFAEATASYVCYINGYKERVADGAAPTMDYYLTDGLYGAMNCLVSVPVLKPVPVASCVYPG